MEHEELPMSVQQVHQNVRPTLAALPQMSTERHHGAFSQVTALPLSFSIKPDDTVSLYRARMDNRDVILRVLKGKVSGTKPNLKHTGPTFYYMSAAEEALFLYETFHSLKDIKRWSFSVSFHIQKL